MRTRTLSLVAILIAGFMDLLDVTIVNVALPTITSELGASAAQAQWILTGYTLTFALGLISGARIGRIVGLRRAFIWGVLGFTVASLACGLAPSAATLVIARIVQGLFAALMVPQVLSLVQVMYAPTERARPMAAFASLLGIAASAGPIVGGLLIAGDVAGSGWRAIFLVNIPIGIGVAIMAARTLPAAKPEGRAHLDPLGLALAGGGLLLLLYPLSSISDGAPLIQVIPPMLAGIGLLVAFFYQQRRRERQGREPLLPSALLREHSFRSGLGVQLLFFAPVLGFSLTITQYLQAGAGYSPLIAGLTVLPWSLTVGIGAGIGTGALLPRMGRGVIQLGLITMAAGIAVVALTINLSSPPVSPWALIPGSAIGGLGMGLVVAPLAELILSGVPARLASDASGIFTSVGQLSAALGFATIGTAYFTALRTTPLTPESYQHALTTALAYAALILGVALIASLALPRPGNHQDSSGMAPTA